MISVTATLSGTALLAAPRAPLSLTYQVSDSDPFITTGKVTIDWGDGTWVAINPSALPAVSSLSHTYGPGVFRLLITAVNFRAPRPDTAMFQQVITVTQVNGARPDAPAVVVGPILPRTQGFPTSGQWAFNTGRDGVILESSLRMLLLTSKGERIKDPEYGTRLRALVFSLQSDDLSGAIRSEITQAVAQYERRVEFLSSQVTRSVDGRTINVRCEFNSLLSNQPMVLDLGFTP